MSGSQPAASERRSARGRWAPSPTGALHVGNARTALVAWLSIRQRAGTFVWRVEDLDGPRNVPGLAEAHQRDLAWLGLDWDEGPDRGGPHRPYRQSERSEHYAAALRRLERAGRLFPCSLSRRELQEIASAPHGPESSPYPPALRPSRVEAGWLDPLLPGFHDTGSHETAPHETAADGVASDGAAAAVRFRVDPVEVAWQDLALGEQRDRVERTTGDFVLLRRDGLWAYQLAVVVDDLAMEIDEVVRGLDLVSSTGRQILLFEALATPGGGGATPRFGHVPLMVGPDGDKLSKRHGSLTLQALREAGVAAQSLVGYLALTLGLRDRLEPATASELVGELRWSELKRQGTRPTVVPLDLADRLRRGEAPSAPDGAGSDRAERDGDRR